MAHTVKYQLEMPREEHVSGKNLFWSTLIGKSRERKHCPFEPPANQHSQFGHQGWIGSAGWLVAQKGNVGRNVLQ